MCRASHAVEGGGDLNAIRPESVDGFRQTLKSHQKVKLCGHGSNHSWLPESTAYEVSTKSWNGIIDFRPDDLVVQVKSGTQLSDLLNELESSGLTLPVANTLDYGFLAHSQGSLGGWLALGLPHIHQAKFGPIKDWVTGMTVMLSNGEVVKVGANVVKSVAGYDIHRTMVGSRGTLGLILDATLRLQSLARVGEPDVYWAGQKYAYVSRVPISDFERVANSIKGVVAADCQAGLVWSTGKPDHPMVVWTLGPRGYCHPRPPESVLKVQRKLKGQFDPLGLFAPGFAHE